MIALHSDIATGIEPKYTILANLAAGDFEMISALLYNAQDKGDLETISDFRTMLCASNVELCSSDPEARQIGRDSYENVKAYWISDIDYYKKHERQALLGILAELREQIKR